MIYEYNGNQYKFLFPVKVKQLGRWVDGIAYKRAEDEGHPGDFGLTIHIRTINDFNSKFKEVK